MDRRSFLQALAVALTVPAIPFALSEGNDWQAQLDREARARWDKFDPKAQYGNAVELTSKAGVDVGKEVLLRDAKWVLPPGTKFYVLEGPVEDHFNDHYSLAWYYTPKPLSDEKRKMLLCEVVA